MEQWEIDLRAELEEEIPKGIYNIGSEGVVVYTGKGGVINYIVLLESEIRGLSILIREQIRKEKENYDKRPNGDYDTDSEAD
jgi:hypothetical protein